MPSKSQPRNDYIMSSGDVGYVLELKRNSRQHSKSKSVKEKALSPRTSLKFQEKIKADIPIRPPHTDLPSEFVKNSESGVFVRTKAGGNHQQQQAGKNGNKNGELVKHMSTLPGFLQRGEKPQDKILNFGVLDWERLEKWKHKQKQSSGRRRATGESYAGSSSSASTKVSSLASEIVKGEVLLASHSEIYSSEKADPASGILPDSSIVTCNHDFGATEKYSSDAQRGKIRKDKSNRRGISEKKSHNTKGPDSYQKGNLEMGMSSSKLSSCSVSTSNENISDDSAEKTVEKCKELESRPPGHQHHHEKQDSVILLLPKDFSRSGCLDESQCTFLSRNSEELNWSSFSDVFSIEELHFEELTSDASHSCPLPSIGSTEPELDINLDRLIHDQRMQLPSDQLSLSAHLGHKLSASYEVKDDGNKEKELTSSTASETCEGLDNNSSHLNSSNDGDPSPTRQFSFGIRRLTRSLSFKESSTLPQLKRASISSGPAEALNFQDNSTDDPVNGKSKVSPFRRLLDPILKPKTAKPINLVDSSVSYIENLKNLSIKGTNNGQAIQNEKSGSMVIKAVLQLTVKSGLPLFKLFVETSNEILASTVKRLNTLERDDPSWLYSFYSVQEVKRKSSSWIYHGNKGKNSDFSYNVIGQMKVSEPLPCADEYDLEEQFTRESVLYGADLSKVDEATSESAVNRELGAILIKMPKEVSRDDQEYEADSTAEITPGSIVVILPGAVHSLPNEGVPASLIDRWRSGGLCDCGGWDVGCKLQVLTNQHQDDKLLKSSTYPLQHHCNLFLKGASEQNTPVFRLAAHGNGVYSIEYNSVISSLQAFAISVAVLSDQKQANLSGANSYGGDRKGHYRSRSSIVQGEGTRYATYPPHSPVGRA